jgi:hypothetical protein
MANFIHTPTNAVYDRTPALIPYIATDECVASDPYTATIVVNDDVAPTLGSKPRGF